MKKFLINIFILLVINISVLEIAKCRVEGIENIVEIDNVKTDMKMTTTTIEQNDTISKWSSIQRKYCYGPTKVEVSHYSENESTDIPGCESIGSTGKHLDDGDIAMPYEFPAYTEIKLKDYSGNYIENGNGGYIFTNTDRGNPRIVTTYNSPDQYGNELRIDRFMKNASSNYLNKLGVKNCTMEIIRWGRNDVIDTSNKITINKEEVKLSANISMTVN